METKNKIKFEWDLETANKHGDIIDHEFSDELSGLPECNANQELILVRDVLDASGSVDDRTWSYIKDNVLPLFFSDAGGNDRFKVPAKYHAEFRDNRNPFHHIKRPRTLADIKADPRVDSVHQEEADGHLEPPTWWCYLKAGWQDSNNPECHTLHEDTISDIAYLVHISKPWKDDPEFAHDAKREFDAMNVDVTYPDGKNAHTKTVKELRERWDDETPEWQAEFFRALKKEGTAQSNFGTYKLQRS